MNKIYKRAIFVMLLNISLGGYYIFLGIITYSWWLLTSGVYYLILSAMRFTVIRFKKSGYILTKFIGMLLMLLSLPLAGTVILSAVRERGYKFNIIIMITIAVYAFTKITLAIINFIKSRRNTPVRYAILRNISLADAFMAIFSLQRSMLVSFEGMTPKEIVVINILTGTGVCIIVFLLGFNLNFKKIITN